MKKFISRILVVFMAVVSLSTLVACGNREACYAKLPTTMLEGVESVTCNSSYTENGITKPGTLYEGKYTITITLKPGYSIGTLVLTADEENAIEHKYYKDKTSTENSVSYNFEDVKKTVKFGLSGKTALIDYSIDITISELIEDSENVFNSVNFEYVTVNGGETQSSGIKTGSELLTEKGENFTLTLNYGDTFTLKAWHTNPKTAVYTDIFSSDNVTPTESFNVDKNGIIKTFSSIEITSNVSITIYKDNFTADCSNVDSTICLDSEILSIQPTILVGTELFEAGVPTITDFASNETYNLAVDISETNIASYVLTNYIDDALSFYVNGKAVEKSSITITDGQFVVLDQKRPYEFVDAEGNTSYAPKSYNIEVKGVAEFLEENKDEFLDFELTIDESFGEKLSVKVKTIVVQNKYYDSNVKIQITMHEDVEFSIEATNEEDEVIIIEDVQTIENATPETGVVITKDDGEDQVWTIEFDSSLKITKINIK